MCFAAGLTLVCVYREVRSATGGIMDYVTAVGIIIN